MDLDDVKPPGFDGAITGPLDQSPQTPEPGNSSRQAFALQPQAAPPQASPLLTSVAHLDKTVFEDPAKLEGAVRASISELIDSGQSATGPISSSDKEFLTSYLAGDPLMRRQVEGLLRKVLT